MDYHRDLILVVFALCELTNGKCAGILARTDKNDPGKFRNFPEALGPKNAKKHIKNAILKSSPIIYEK